MCIRDRLFADQTRSNETDLQTVDGCSPPLLGCIHHVILPACLEEVVPLGPGLLHLAAVSLRVLLREVATSIHHGLRLFLADADWHLTLCVRLLSAMLLMRLLLCCVLSLASLCLLRSCLTPAGRIALGIAMTGHLILRKVVRLVLTLGDRLSCLANPVEVGGHATPEVAQDDSLLVIAAAASWTSYAASVGGFPRVDVCTGRQVTVIGSKVRQA